MAHEIRLYDPIPANADQLVKELEALNIPGVRTYAVFGSPGQCAGVYPWSDKAPAGQYLHMDEMGQTMTPADENRIRQAISDHKYTPPPDPDVELTKAIEQVAIEIDSAVALVDLKPALKKLCNALLGKVRPGRVQGRPV